MYPSVLGSDIHSLFVFSRFPALVKGLGKFFLRRDLETGTPTSQVTKRIVPFPVPNNPQFAGVKKLNYPSEAVKKLANLPTVRPVIVYGVVVIYQCLIPNRSFFFLSHLSFLFQIITQGHVKGLVALAYGDALLSHQIPVAEEFTIQPLSKKGHLRQGVELPEILSACKLPNVPMDVLRTHLMVGADIATLQHAP